MNPATGSPIHPPRWIPKKLKMALATAAPMITEHDIHQDPHFTLHELFCQPACNAADDDGCDPAYLMRRPWLVSSKGARLVNSGRLVMFKLKLSQERL